MTPDQVRAAVEGFSLDYVNDWSWWLTVPEARRPQVIGQILRRWQATRPQPMRRTQAEATHAAPYLEDLVADAQTPLRALGALDVSRIGVRTGDQEAALHALWADFARLSATGSASCVGITKGVLLVSDGRIGPALDSQVRERLGIARPATSVEWLGVLDAISDDIATFEGRHGRLQDVVPDRFAHLAVGRLYDMALGPRGATSAR